MTAAMHALFLCTSILTGVVLVACNRHGPRSEEPDPSEGPLVLGIALGACPDVLACERECAAGSADRCRRLAASYAFGQGVEKDETLAAELYEHACDMKDSSACMFAGQMSEFSRGVAKDDAKAARLYARACDLRWAAGCYNLAIMYERGTGEPVDRRKAGDLYQLACAAGAKEACDKAKEMREPPPTPFADAGTPL